MVAWTAGVSPPRPLRVSMLAQRLVAPIDRQQRANRGPRWAGGASNDVGSPSTRRRRAAVEALDAKPIARVHVVGSRKHVALVGKRRLLQEIERGRPSRATPAGSRSAESRPPRARRTGPSRLAAPAGRRAIPPSMPPALRSCRAGAFLHLAEDRVGLVVLIVHDVAGGLIVEGLFRPAFGREPSTMRRTVVRNSPRSPRSPTASA